MRDSGAKIKTKKEARANERRADIGVDETTLPLPTKAGSGSG